MKALNTHFTETGDIWMTNKDKKRCSKSLVTREFHIKITMSHHYTTIRMSKIETLTRMQITWNLHIMPRGVKNGMATLAYGLAVTYKDQHTFTT